MTTALVPVKDLATFRLSSLIAAVGKPIETQGDKALCELLGCVDDLLLKAPLGFRDFLLRFFRASGWPIDYPSLPLWAERAGRHIFTIFYPTLRNVDWHNPSPEHIGKLCGHLLAIVSHAKAGTAIFQRFPDATKAEVQAFFAKIETPLRVLIDDGQRMPPHQATLFIHGFAHAYERTFDVVGMPRGWNTNSPVLLGLCMGWRFIVAQSPSLASVHRSLSKLFGQQEVGTEDRVKKICHRLGLRFGGDRAVDSQGTSIILDVPAQVETTSDK